MIKLNLIFLLFISLFFFTDLKGAEKVYSKVELSSLYMSPSVDAPIIYPIEQGKEFIVKEKKDSWFHVIDEQTGLVGWVKSDLLSKQKPSGIFKRKNYNESFKNFKGRVLEMSQSIKDAISVETFIDVKHLGGAAAVVIAHNDWFNGRRHSNQAFQVYDMWMNQNQSPSFLSFRDESGDEKFIILSGPHRPRYLKSSK